MLLARNRSNGHIQDATVSPAVDLVFTGGFFRPFTRDPDNGAVTPAFQLVDGNGDAIELVFPDAGVLCADERAKRAGCQCFTNPATDPKPPAEEAFWDWNMAFQSLSDRGINLVRVFGMNGTEFKRRNAGIIDVYPFNRDASNKLLVEAAVDRSDFNRAYFQTYLRPFVQQANQNGIAVQFCLFSFHDFLSADFDYFKYWPLAPWNAAGTLPQAWGETNLVPTSVGNPISRNIYFTDVAHDNLLRVQKWWLGCVMQTLNGLPNVILELFNEPRSVRRNDAGAVVEDGRVRLVTWYNAIVQYLQTFFTPAWRPLISVNPVFDDGFQQHDIDLWKQLFPVTFAEVDIVSHHGLTGYGTIDASPCGRTGQFAPVAPVHIRNRIAAHKAAWNDKALLFSTDAVRPPTHEFSDIARPDNILELTKRDGQIVTSLPNESTAPVSTLVSESDLENWVFWSVTEMIKPANRGQVHFQNHSIYKASFDYIAAGRVDAMNAGTMLRPAYSTPDWSKYGYLSDPHAGRNFWWAQRHLVTEGGSVTQLGTADAPVDPRWEMAVETGWRCNFTPPRRGWCCFRVAYTPVSVSVRSSGAAVTPFVVARLAEVAAGGALRPAFVQAERFLAPGAAPGTLVLCGDVVAGRQYALVFAGGVNINYRNRYKGYGETIVHFPSVRKVVP